MNRIDRVTAILIQLQSKKVVKAKEIADRFSISLRTVYRDVKTLEEAGIPIIGEAGIGYSIMEGYRLPPVMFNKEEAIAFLTAEKMVEKLTDPASRGHFQSAMFKIKAVLRSSEKDLLDDIDSHIEVLENPYLPTQQQNQSHLQTILKSIAGKVVLDIGYYANQSQQYTNREVEPVGIFFQGNYWYLVAYCRLRNDYRNFRTDRISYIKPTSKTFNKKHPSLQSFLSKTGKEKDLFTIIIKVEKQVLPYFGEQKYYNGFVSQREVDGKMEMTFLAASLRGFGKFYLLFAEYAEIISPAGLKDIIRQNIAEISKKLP
ncbi:helix-turn-helix transcriptional regulator [Flavihumibacter profundi]|uniref:helix-turn-helix transcriptional regulator n=1 Tax=Flavihumibacter profundi TaxID=2716883 RepID=UPI001CC73B96|nr:YafY family protein [Flavihumibacter profundi]MBZ5859211.1 YafY family transcriptional regulator [Flavihumibacter profundi]